jgi:two-component system LytT family response regulator
MTDVDRRPAPLRVVLVDDEAPARALLREYLAAHPEVEIVAECANGFAAVKDVREHAPDLVFLDVQMPRLDGFEVLELLLPAPLVVFCTAYDEYALKAFDVHAVDYLLKPYGRERLAEALLRVEARRAAAGAAPVATPWAGTLAAMARAPGAYAERLVVKDGSEIHVIPVAALDYVEAQDDYVALHAGGKSWLKPQTLAEVEAALDPARFVRVHRSFVVALDRVARIEPYAKDSRIAVLKDGTEIPVSRGGYQRLREVMGT